MILKVQYVSIWVLGAVLAMALNVSQAKCDNPPRSLQKELSQAREDLRISRAGQTKIKADLEKLKRSGSASAGTIDDYEQYLDRMQALVSQNQNTVRRLEALQQKYGVEKTGAPQSTDRQPDGGADPEIPESSANDPVDELDRQLDQSIAAFDVALLKEMELIKIQSTKKTNVLKDEVEAARQRLEAQGIHVDGDSAAQTGDASSDENPAENTTDRPDGMEENADTGEHVPTETGATESGGIGQGAQKPGDRAGSLSEEEERRYGRGEDDDIVARQLREAALKESDPELRKKLWKEYETYKGNL